MYFNSLFFFIHFPANQGVTKLCEEDLREEGNGTQVGLTCCVSIQGCILRRLYLKANYVTMPHKGCPNSKAPPNAVHKCSLLVPALLLSSWPHISQDSLRAQKRRTSHGVDRHLRWPGRQKSLRTGETSGDATRKCSKG